MFVLRKEPMYVSKPFGGEEEGKGSQQAHYSFLKKVLSAQYVPITCALCPHTAGTSCTPTRRMPSMGFLGNWLPDEFSMLVALRNACKRLLSLARFPVDFKGPV